MSCAISAVTFRSSQDPDSYVELSWAIDPIYIRCWRAQESIISKASSSGFEMRVDTPWTQFFATDAYQSGHFLQHACWNPDAQGNSPAASILDTPFRQSVWEQTRLDLAYGLQYPITLTEGVTLTPLATVRGISYETQRFENVNEARADLAQANLARSESDLHRQLGLRQSVLEYQRVSPLFQPVISYRYREGDAFSRQATSPSTALQ